MKVKNKVRLARAGQIGEPETEEPLVAPAPWREPKHVPVPEPSPVPIAPQPVEPVREPEKVPA